LAEAPATTAALLAAHVARLQRCNRCPRMLKPVVTGGPVASQVMLVGQAPGIREPQAGKPFAWTAGRTLFKWFQEFCGIDEEQFRSRIYMAAVCRCFPGRNNTGGDRVPDRDEVENCSRWLRAEVRILQPRLVLPVGRLAIAQFVEPTGKMDEIIGRTFRISNGGHEFDLIPLPHPSGASPWHRIAPGKSLLAKAMRCIALHPAMRRIIRS
jgi:uracil-DNA glycosylase